MRHAAPSGGGGSVNRPVLAAIAAGVLGIVALGGWGLSGLGGDGGHPKQKISPQASSTAKQTARRLKPANVKSDNDPPHPDRHASNNLANVIDSNNASVWTTEGYETADFGRYRPGVGLVIDMGKTVTVARVKVSMPSASTPGSVELRVGDVSGTNATKTDTGDASGDFELNGKQTRGRYLTLWFTRLPRIGKYYRATVRDVSVYGTD